jgi:hypothetical protein
MIYPFLTLYYNFLAGLVVVLWILLAVAAALLFLPE